MARKKSSRRLNKTPAKSMFKKTKKPQTGSTTIAVAKPQKQLHVLDVSIHKYRQKVYETTIVQTAAIVNGALNCTIGQVPQFATFSALYDQYRIDYCEFTFRPRITNFSMTTGVPGVLPVPPFIQIAVDKDSSAAITQAALEEYQTVETHRFEIFTKRFKPGVLGGVWDGATIAPGLHKLSPWIDVGQSAIPHYGILYSVDAGLATTLFQIWDVELFIGMSFKCVR